MLRLLLLLLAVFLLLDDLVQQIDRAVFLLLRLVLLVVLRHTILPLLWLLRLRLRVLSAGLVCLL